MAKVRTFDARGVGRRFRPETVARVEKKRLRASIGQQILAKQVARSDRREE